MLIRFTPEVWGKITASADFIRTYDEQHKRYKHVYGHATYTAGLAGEAAVYAFFKKAKYHDTGERVYKKVSWNLLNFGAHSDIIVDGAHVEVKTWKEDRWPQYGGNIDKKQWSSKLKHNDAFFFCSCDLEKHEVKLRIILYQNVMPNLYTCQETTSKYGTKEDYVLDDAPQVRKYKGGIWVYENGWWALKTKHQDITVSADDFPKWKVDIDMTDPYFPVDYIQLGRKTCTL